MTRIWQETYETERLRLRPLTMNDGDALYPLQRNAEIMRYFGGSYRREQTDTWLEWHVAMWQQEATAIGPQESGMVARSSAGSA